MNSPLENNDLDKLRSRLEEANSSLADNFSHKTTKTKKGGAIGIAFRVGVELISAITVSTAIGWWLDKWLDSSPWLMILFIFVGFSAGMWNIYKLTINFGIDERKHLTKKPSKTFEEIKKEENIV